MRRRSKYYQIIRDLLSWGIHSSAFSPPIEINLKEILKVHDIFRYGKFFESFERDFAKRESVSIEIMCLFVSINFLFSSLEGFFRYSPFHFQSPFPMILAKWGISFSVRLVFYLFRNPSLINLLLFSTSHFLGLGCTRIIDLNLKKHRGRWIYKSLREIYEKIREFLKMWEKINYFWESIFFMDNYNLENKINLLKLAKTIILK